MDYLFQTFEDILLTDDIKYSFEDVLDKYKTYLDKLEKLELRKQKLYLAFIKNREIIATHETEQQESFMLGLYSSMQKENSIDVTKAMFQKGNITKDDVKEIHSHIIKGSLDDKIENYEYRSDNDKWVGTFNYKGERIVHYIPPNYEMIDPYLNIILNYLNEKNIDDTRDILLRPFVVHALIAYLQPFGNGNTRLGRAVQHGKIWQMTNEVYNHKFEDPTLYLSDRYLATRGDYRNRIKNLANYKDDTRWNSWFMYNLYMIDEKLTFLDTQLNQYIRAR